MIDGTMSFEFLSDFPMDAAFVSSEMRLPGSDGDDQRTDGFRRDVRDMKRTRLAFTLHQREYSFLWWRSLIGTVPSFAADIGLVSFDEPILAAERAGGGGLVHAFADAVFHEPCRFIIDFEGPVHLVRREAFFRSRH